MKVAFVRTSAASGIKRTRIYDVPAEGFEAWDNGEMHIQEAMPNLTADEREFIISGTTQEEWDELFKEDDEL